MDSEDNRLILSEWVKFSLQINVEEVTTRNNLLHLLQDYIGQINHSFKDYQHLLAFKRQLLDDKY